MKNYIIILIFFLLSSIAVPAQVMTTFAGTPGVFSFSGDGGPAGSAELNYPWSVAVDRKGNVYISDLLNARIRKVNNSGIIRTIAGNGTHGVTSEGCPATATSLEYPSSVAVDNKGNIYIADNNIVRKVDTMGIISVFAGDGSLGWTGEGGPATAAAIGYPDFVAVDFSGNVYFADNENYIIRRVSPSGIINIVAGIPSTDNFAYSGDGGRAIYAELGNINGMTVDGAGNVYISNRDNCVVRKVNTSGIINIFAGTRYVYPMPFTCGLGCDGGPATASEICYPSGLAADREGNVYICGSAAVYKVDTAGMITTAAGVDTMWGYNGDGGPATKALLSQPNGEAVDSAGNIYIVDFGNAVIRKVIVAGVAAVNNINAPASIDIYPNPVPIHGIMYINKVPDVSTYVLENSLGRIIQSGALLAGKNAISLNGLPPAVYILEITGFSGEKTRRKIIKQ